MTKRQVHWIDQPESLARLGQIITGADVIAVDTEQDSFYSYVTKVCVIQVGALGEEWIIDSLALSDLSALGDAFLDTSIPKIFHAGENDIDLLRRHCHLEIRNLFDTMAAASILGYRKTGLAGLIERHFGFTIEKKYQRSDWRKRPLAREQIDYAALDVRYLARLRDILSLELESLGRVEEAESDFGRIEKVVHEPRVFNPDDYYRMTGARDLDGLGRRALRELYVFREKVAADEDRAVFRVCGDRALIELASTMPTSVQKLSRMRGLSRRLMERFGNALLHHSQSSKGGASRPPEA